MRSRSSGTKAVFVNCRAGDGGRKAPGKRVVIGLFDRVTPDRARRTALELLGKVEAGGVSAEKRAETGDTPILGDAPEDYKAANPKRSRRANELRI